MTSETIKILLKSCSSSQKAKSRTGEDFVHLYTNPSVGWFIASTLADGRIWFPITVLERDCCLFQAYAGMLRPDLFVTPEIDEAYRLSSDRTAGVLKALLMAGVGEKPEKHLEAVAKRTGLSFKVISVFETLFFNVLDRPEDSLYLAELVHPNGRVAEFSDDYFATTSVDDLLLRAAYDHRDMDFVEHLAGLNGNDFVEALKGRNDTEQKLASKIIGNAQLLANLGGSNTSKSPALDIATKLIAKNKTKKIAPPLQVPEGYDIGSELRAALEAAVHAEYPQAAETANATAAGSPKTVQAAESATGIRKFDRPRKAIWRNADSDMPVQIVALMTAPGLPDHYQTSTGTGIPVSEVDFED